MAYGKKMAKKPMNKTLKKKQKTLPMALQKRIMKAKKK